MQAKYLFKAFYKWLDRISIYYSLFEERDDMKLLYVFREQDTDQQPRLSGHSLRLK